MYCPAEYKYSKLQTTGYTQQQEGHKLFPWNQDKVTRTEKYYEEKETAPDSKPQNVSELLDNHPIISVCVCVKYVNIFKVCHHHVSIINNFQ